MELDDILAELNKPLDQLNAEAGVTTEEATELFLSSFSKKVNVVVAVDVAKEFVPILPSSGNQISNLVLNLVNDLKNSVNSVLIGFGILIENNNYNLDTRNSEGYTVLMIASKIGDVRIVEILLEAGADRDIEVGGITALDIAKESDDKEVFKVFIKHTAIMINNMKANKFNDALDLLKLSDYALLKSFGPRIKVSGDIDEKEPHHGETALITSCDKGKIELVLPLIKAGADVNAVDNGGQTPLIAAAKNGFFEIAKILIEYGADIYNEDCTSMEAFDFANIKNTPDYPQFQKIYHLIKDEKATHKLFKLDYFLTKTNGLTAPFKISKNLKIRDKSHGNSILHFLAYSKQVDILENLLNYGADPRLINFEGKTFMDILVDVDAIIPHSLKSLLLKSYI